MNDNDIIREYSGGHGLTHQAEEFITYWRNLGANPEERADELRRWATTFNPRYCRTADEKEEVRRNNRYTIMLTDEVFRLLADERHEWDHPTV